MSTKGVGGDGQQKFVETKEVNTGTLEGGQRVTANPQVSKVLINVPQWILRNPEAGLLERLSAAMTNQEVGAVRGLFTVIYYAIAGIAGWKLPSKERQIERLEEQFNKGLKPEEYKTFLNDVSRLNQKQTSERLNKLEQGVGEKILGMKVELRNVDLPSIDDKALVTRYRNVEEQISSLKKTDINHDYGDIFVQSSLGRTRENIISMLEGSKEEIQKEFDNRAIKARKKLETISTGLKEAKSRLQELENALSLLKSTDQKEKSKMVNLQKKLEHLKEREKTIPDEINRLQEDLVRDRKNKIDNKIKQWDEQIKKSKESIRSEEGKVDLNNRSVDQLRFNALTEKKIRLIKEDKREGIFDILNVKETNELKELDIKMGAWKRIDDTRKKIKEIEEQKAKELIEFQQEHIQPMELKIKNLKELPEKIKSQERAYKVAVGESEAAHESYTTAKNKIPVLKRDLILEKEKVNPELKKYAEAIAFQKGLKIEGWNPNKRPYPTQILEAVGEGLKEFSFLEIDPKTLLQ